MDLSLTLSTMFAFCFLAANPTAGQADYSQQWIEYYRSMGQNELADQIAKQMKEVLAIHCPLVFREKQTNNIYLYILVGFNDSNTKFRSECLGSLCTTMDECSSNNSRIVLHYYQW